MEFNEKYQDNFIKNVNLFLQEKNWSRLKFSKILGCDSSLVSKWLKGRQEPGLKYIVKITAALNCTFEELVN